MTLDSTSELVYNCAISSAESRMFLCLTGETSRYSVIRSIRLLSLIENILHIDVFKYLPTVFKYIQSPSTCLTSQRSILPAVIYDNSFPKSVLQSVVIALVSQRSV